METTELEYGRGRRNFQWNDEIHKDQKKHQWQRHFVGPTLILRTKVKGLNGIKYPSSPSHKQWILSIVHIDMCSVVVNALRIPLREYVHKNETQRNW